MSIVVGAGEALLPSQAPLGADQGGPGLGLAHLGVAVLQPELAGDLPGPRPLRGDGPDLDALGERGTALHVAALTGNAAAGLRRRGARRQAPPHRFQAGRTDGAAAARPAAADAPSMVPRAALGYRAPGGLAGQAGAPISFEARAR